jgi:hypothetical protein
MFNLLSHLIQNGQFLDSGHHFRADLGGFLEHSRDVHLCVYFHVHVLFVGYARFACVSQRMQTLRS